MRTKDDIIKVITDEQYWTDQDVSRKAHQTDILIEVLIDIRDQLSYLAEAIDTHTYDIAKILPDILEQLRISQFPPKDNPIREKWRNEVKKTREERDED